MKIYPCNNQAKNDKNDILTQRAYIDNRKELANRLAE